MWHIKISSSASGGCLHGDASLNRSLGNGVRNRWGPQSMSVSTMRASILKFRIGFSPLFSAVASQGRYWHSVSAFLLDSLLLRVRVDTEIPYRLFSLILCCCESGSILTFRIGFPPWFSAVASHLRLSLLVGFGGIKAVDTENFRIGFLSSIGVRLPYPCLPTPFPILRLKVAQRLILLHGKGVRRTAKMK